MSMFSMIHLHHYLSIPYLVVVVIVPSRASTSRRCEQLKVYLASLRGTSGIGLIFRAYFPTGQLQRITAHIIIAESITAVRHHHLHFGPNQPATSSTNLCDQLDSMVYDLRWLPPSLVDLTVSNRCVAYQKCWCTTCLYQYVIASSSGGTGTGNNYFFYFYCKV